MKRTVLILLARYLPGVKSGGPIRSIAGLVESLGDEIEFRIVTMDRDKDDEAHYPGIEPDTWNRVGKALVLYLSPRCLNARSLFKILAAERADVLYVNSFFGRYFSMVPLLARSLGARGQRNLVLAPRGEFSRGALKLKAGRKRAWIELARRLPGYKDLCWHASSPEEVRDIEREFGPKARIRVALPISWVESAISGQSNSVKQPGTLKIAFLARIVQMKNLLQGLEVLKNISGQVEFNIYGPAEDRDYWRRCEAQIEELPTNIRVNVLGLVPHSSVAEILSRHHLYLLPTLGENYGHGIFDALNAGCPVLISDRTPWRGLELANAGWDLPLDRSDLYIQALEQCVAMTDLEFRHKSECARGYVSRFVADARLREANRALFAESFN